MRIKQLIIDTEILTPVITLIAKSLIILMRMYATRIPAMSKAKVDVDQLVKDPDASLDRSLPANVQWKAHNYAHLMEQPTVFYPAVVILAVMGAGTVDVALAWIYVALRIIHSLYQATVNVVKIRFLIFLLATIVLTILAVRAVMVTLFADPGVL